MIIKLECETGYDRNVFSDVNGILNLFLSGGLVFFIYFEIEHYGMQQIRITLIALNCT